MLAGLFRFMLIILGYAVASLSASLFLNIVLLAWFGLSAEETRMVATNSFVFSIPLVAFFTAYLAFFPALVAIAIGEIAGKRDWLFYALGGGAVSLVIIGLDRAADTAAYAGAADLNLALVIIGAGMCGGIGYWLVAGRSAGSLRRKDEPTLPAS